MTPMEFAEKYIATPMDEYVCLVHDPREGNPPGRTYTVQYLGNVVDGTRIKYLNVDVELMKDIAMRMLQDGMPVWMGCDTGSRCTGTRDCGMPICLIMVASTMPSSPWTRRNVWSITKLP